MPYDAKTTYQDFLEKVQQLLACCSNEEHLLLKTAVIIDHLLNQYCQSGIPSSSGLDVPDLRMRNKYYVLQQYVNVPVHTSVCMDLLIEQQDIITEKLYYSRSNLDRLISTLSAKYPAISDHTRQSGLLGAKYALTLFCFEVFSITL